MAKTTNMSATKDRYFYLWQVYVYQHWQAFSITAYIFSKQGWVTSSTAESDQALICCLPIHLRLWTSWPAQHDSGQHSQQRKEWKPVSGDSGWHAGHTLWPARHGALHNGQGSWNIRNTQREKDAEKLIVISDWVCHELNVNIGQSEDLQHSRLANQRSQFL